MLTDEQVQDKKYMVYLPVLLEILYFVLYVIRESILLDSTVGIFIFIILGILINLVILFLCFKAFKSIGQLIKNKKLSFLVIVGGLLDIIIFILNLILLYYTSLILIYLIVEI